MKSSLRCPLSRSPSSLSRPRVRLPPAWFVHMLLRRGCAGHRDEDKVTFLWGAMARGTLRAAPRVLLLALLIAAGVLLDRARRCMRESGHLPNFVAVDFYDVGDVFAVVDALNQEPPP